MYFKINLIGNMYSIMGHELAKPIIGEVSPDFYYAASSYEELDQKIELLKKRNKNYVITDVIKEEIPDDEFLAYAKRTLLEIGSKLEARELGMTEEEFEEKKDSLIADENFYAKCITNIVCLVESYPLELRHERKDIVS